MEGHNHEYSDKKYGNSSSLYFVQIKLNYGPIDQV